MPEARLETLVNSDVTRKSIKIRASGGKARSSAALAALTEPVASAERQNRNERARERTRKKLVDAAYRVMSRVGVEATTISQITEEADVGFGSFYNYFSSKEEIARTVFHEQLAAFSDHLDRTNAGIEDPSVRLSRNIFRILSQARIDPVWGWFFVHGEYALQELRSVFWMNHQRNLKQGLQLGVYQFDVSPLTVGDIAFGATISVMRSILEGRASSAAELETVELLMGVFGVSADRARTLVSDISLLAKELRKDTRQARGRRLRK